MPLSGRRRAAGGGALHLEHLASHGARLSTRRPAAPAAMTFVKGPRGPVPSVHCPAGWIRLGAGPSRARACPGAPARGQGGRTGPADEPAPETGVEARAHRGRSHPPHGDARAGAPGPGVSVQGIRNGREQARMGQGEGRVGAARGGRAASSRRLRDRPQPCLPDEAVADPNPKAANVCPTVCAGGHGLRPAGPRGRGRFRRHPWDEMGDPVPLLMSHDVHLDRGRLHWPWSRPGPRPAGGRWVGLRPGWGRFGRPLGRGPRARGTLGAGRAAWPAASRGEVGPLGGHRGGPQVVRRPSPVGANARGLGPRGAASRIRTCDPGLKRPLRYHCAMAAGGLSLPSHLAPGRARAPASTRGGGDRGRA